MRVFFPITTSLKYEQTTLPDFEDLVRRDPFREHEIVSDPSVADLILFTDAHQHEDWTIKAIQNHPLADRYREQSFLYSVGDQPWCAMQGLYVSMPKSCFNWQRQRPFCYTSNLNPYIESTYKAFHDPDLLFSFIGRRCHKTRDQILNLTHPQAILSDTTQLNFFSRDKGIEKHQQHYAEIIYRSKFVLCPRGAGPASFRLFETLAAGRVPVIISDEWVSPTGPDWGNCALFVPESEVASLPAIIEANLDRYPAMAENARVAWEQWFSRDVLFHRMIENCVDILANRRLSEAAWRRIPDSRYLNLRRRNILSKLKKEIHKLTRASHTKLT